MEHYVKIYPGNYKIKTKYSTDYLYQLEADINSKYYHFYASADKEALLQTILELDTNDDKEILNFHRSYGLLVNTLNNPKEPTYCGKFISQKTNEQISLFTSGIAYPKYLFKFYIELLKNIFNLSTEISLFHQKGQNYEEERNLIRMLKYFLTLLFQPYTIMDTSATMINPIIEDMDREAPLSRFAFHYHTAFQSAPGSFSKESLRVFCDRLKIISQMNLRAKSNIPSASEKLHQEKDIPTYKPPARFHISMEKENNEGFILYFNFSDTFYLDTATEDYNELSQVLYSLNKYCEYSFDKLGSLDLSFIDKSALFSDTQFWEKISKLGKKLLIATLNTYTHNIHFQLKQFDEKELSKMEYDEYKEKQKKKPHSNSWEYRLACQSSCLLQSLFLITADMLDEYSVSTCKYPGCAKTFFYKLTKPKICCCHKHLDSYLKLKKRNSPKLIGS